MLAAVRKKTNERLRKRFAKAKLNRDLPSGVDPGTLARFIQTIGWGMAVDAQSRATREDLHRTVAVALNACRSAKPAGSGFSGHVTCS
jgi:hypothetical protein